MGEATELTRQRHSVGLGTPRMRIERPASFTGKQVSRSPSLDTKGRGSIKGWSRCRRVTSGDGMIVLTRGVT